MLYCPSCNDTHWKATRSRKLLALLRLKKELQCGKCGKVLLGSIFLNTGNTADRRARCPACKAKAVRSRRKGIERLIFFIRAYRCQSCKNRFRKVQLTS